MQSKRITKETMIMETSAHSHVVEAAVEVVAVLAEAEMEVEVQEETKPIRKEIVVNNMTDSIYGKSVQQTGTVLPTKPEEEKTEVMVVVAVEA